MRKTLTLRRFAPPPSPARGRGLRTRIAFPLSRLRERVGERACLLLTSLPLAACTATQTSAAVAPTAPGFLLGLWHGFIFPVAWVVSLIVPQVAVYAVPNNGGWYDFGYFLGIVVFGVGARKGATRVIYRDRGGPIVDANARRID